MDVLIGMVAALLLGVLPAVFVYCAVQVSGRVSREEDE
jgi:hypothetical protein